MTTDPRYYSRRFVSPWRGLLQVARQLPCGAFPELPWNEHWPHSGQRRLAFADSRRRAAALLGLQHLSDMRRRRLELTARKCPLQIEKLWRTYPVMRNRSILISARVEARVHLADS